MPAHNPPAYYVMKRAAQQRLAKGWDLHALMLMDELRAWWHCADKQRPGVRTLWKLARRYYRDMLANKPLRQPETRS